MGQSSSADTCSLLIVKWSSIFDYIPFYVPWKQEIWSNLNIEEKNETNMNYEEIFLASNIG